MLLNNFGEKNGNVFVICGVTCVPIKIQFSIDKAKVEKLILSQVECEYKINTRKYFDLKIKVIRRILCNPYGVFESLTFG